MSIGEEPILQAFANKELIKVEEAEGWRPLVHGSWVFRKGNALTYKSKKAAKAATEAFLATCFLDTWRKIPENQSYYIDCLKNSYPKGTYPLGQRVTNGSHPNLEDYYKVEHKAMREWLDKLYTDKVIQYTNV